MAEPHPYLGITGRPAPSLSPFSPLRHSPCPPAPRPPEPLRQCAREAGCWDGQEGCRPRWVGKRRSVSLFRSNSVFRLCHIYVCVSHFPHITRCVPRFVTVMLLLTFGNSRQVSRQGPSAHQEREAGTRTRVSGSQTDCPFPGGCGTRQTVTWLLAGALCPGRCDVHLH